MPTYIPNVCSIVPAADRADLVQMIESLAPEVPIEGATGLWGVPLSADGTEPATHFGCFGWMDEALTDVLPLGVVLDPDDPAFTDPLIPIPPGGP